MKSNKLIAFLCSAAIAVTSIAGFAVASAENTAEDDTLLVTAEAVEKGYKLVFDAENSTATEKFIDVYYVGYNSVKTGTISVEVPEAIAEKITDAGYKSGLISKVTITKLERIKSGHFLNGSFADASYLSSEDKKLFTFDVKLSEDIEDDWELIVRDTSTIEDENGEHEYKDFGVETDAVTKWVDPNATEAPTEPPTPSPSPTPIVSERKTPEPTAVTDPDATEAVPTATPTIKPTQAPVDKGYKLVFDTKNSTATEKFIDVYYVGYNSVKTGTISVEVPEAIAEKITDAGYKSGLISKVTITKLERIKSGHFLNGSFADASYLSSEDKKLFTFDVKLSEDIEDDWELIVRDTSTIEDENGEHEYKDFGVETDTVTAWVDPNATQKPTITDAPTATPYAGDDSVAIKDLVEVPEGKAVAGVYVQVTKDGKDAEYGTDYAAFLDGKELTAEEFENVQNGLTKDGTAYVDDVRADIIDKLVIKGLYGTSVAAGPAYGDEGGKLETPVDEINTEDFTAPTDAPTTAPTDAPTTTPTTAPTSKPAAGGGGGRSSSASAGTIAGGSAVSTGGNGVVTTTTNFQDLGSVPWAEAAINSLASLGVINGRSETIFDPNATVTRAEFAKMVCNAFGLTTNTGNKQTFTDVTLSDWYYEPVEAAAAAGVINGVSDTEFAPNELVTREQMAAMLYRAINYKNITLKTGTALSFTDAWAISEYAVTPVNTLSAAGIINGMDDGSFAPQASATRAQAACIIYQYFASFGA